MPEKKPWTLMVYLSADRRLLDFGVDSLKQMKVPPCDLAHVVAEFDSGRARPVRRYVFNGNGKDSASIAACEVRIAEPVKAGDPKNLNLFIRWAVTHYPAEHYFLIVWGHGAGVADNTASSWLERRPAPGAGKRTRKRKKGLGNPGKCLLMSPAILKRALGEARANIGRKLDILGLDSCQMNMVEIGYQLRGCANLMVASQANTPRRSWPYEPLLRLLASNPEIPPRDLACLTATTYLTSYQDYPDHQVMLSVLDLGFSAQISWQFSNLVSVLRKSPNQPAVKIALRRARRQSRNFGKNLFVDLAHFCRLLAETSTDPALIDTAGAVVAGLKSFVICNRIPASEEHCHGVSVYFPSSKRGVLYHQKRLARSYNKLDFARATCWGPFLSSFLRSGHHHMKSAGGKKQKERTINNNMGRPLDAPKGPLDAPKGMLEFQPKETLEDRNKGGLSDGTIIRRKRKAVKAKQSKKTEK